MVGYNERHVPWNDYLCQKWQINFHVRKKLVPHLIDAILTGDSSFYTSRDQNWQGEKIEITVGRGEWSRHKRTKVKRWTYELIETQWNIRWKCRREARIKYKFSPHFETNVKYVTRISLSLKHLFDVSWIFCIICTSRHIDITLTTLCFLNPIFLLYLIVFRPEIGIMKNTWRFLMKHRMALRNRLDKNDSKTRATGLLGRTYDISFRTRPVLYVSLAVPWCTTKFGSARYMSARREYRRS